uniref:RNA helicase n=1 Tax=Xenopsylla cheopis TaxID=163159 RepID=A0A6M2DMV7_XENCH
MSARAEWPDADKELANKVDNLGISNHDKVEAKEVKAKPDAEKEVDIKEIEGFEGPDVSKDEISLLQKIIRKGLSVCPKEEVEIRRKDPNSPLYSCKTFEELNLRTDLLKGLYTMGYNVPSKIQEAALPALLADPPQNMIAQSQSGTGKTAAFVLAMLSRVDPSKHYPQVLCVNPTYELAIQTGEVTAQMSQFCPLINIKYVVRGEDTPTAPLRDHILIGTPGKLLDWALKLKNFDIKKIRVFVLDEADVMISTQGHQDQCVRLHRELSQNECQMLLFSATYDNDVMRFAEMIVPKPLVIRLLREEESLDNIKQYYVKCASQEKKYDAITNIYGVITIGQAIIFCQTRRTASWLARKMSRDGHSVSVLSGELTVEQRINVLDRFRNGIEKVLITTNVLSRGIDVEQVTIVVNFDLPLDTNKQPDFETYLHRIGRTGRFGMSLFIVTLKFMVRI